MIEETMVDQEIRLRFEEWKTLLKGHHLTGRQSDQLALQLEAHSHDRYEKDPGIGIPLSELTVHPQVMRPEVMSSRWLATYLVRESRIYRGRTVLDMGCGCGIQGIVAAKEGARCVLMSDVLPEAVRNSAENIERFRLTDRCTIYEGDLFESIPKHVTVDVTVFNHPFFEGEPLAGIPITTAMLAPENLLVRFFEQARKFGDGIIVMPFYHLAGDANDPGIKGPLHGYRVTKKVRFPVQEGLQQGEFSIYELSPR